MILYYNIYLLFHFKDMQRKNDDLKNKFDHLESAVGVFDDFGVDTEDMVMLNGIDKKKPAPRMFCDICKFINSKIV